MSEQAPTEFIPMVEDTRIYPAPFTGAGVGQMQTEDLGYGLPLEPLPPQEAPAPPSPCRCDTCKYDQRPPGADAVLYSGPDAMHLFERAAIRDGRYVDACAYANHVVAQLHAKCEAAEFQTRLTLETAWRAWQRFDAARKGVTA